MEFNSDDYDPKKHFIRRRMGRVLMFDRQIKNWQKKRKSKGALKDSIDPSHSYRKPKKIKNIFE